MIETSIDINSNAVAVNHNTFERFMNLMNSLPKKVSEAATFNNTNGSFIKLYHNQKSNSIDVFYGGTTHIGTFTEPMKFGKISTGFNGHNVLDFYFDFSVSISIKEDGSYYYNDHSGFFNLMNNLLEDNIFKIKEV